MRLITEFVDHDLDIICEANKNTGEKQYAIEGVFMQSESKNKNGRIYEKATMEKAVNKYITEQVKTGRAVGELNHPEGPTVNLDKVSHKINDFHWQGNDVVGKASILKTPMGKIVEGLLEGGVKLGVSSRGMGTVERRENKTYVKDDFILNTVDIVQDPSAPSAFVEGIMEGVEWIWDNGLLKAQDVERARDNIRSASSRELEEVKLNEFKNLLSKL